MSESRNMLMVRGEKTSLTRANVSSYSLRTTVPKGIAKQFELGENDFLIWEIRPSPDGKSLMIVVIPEKVSKQNKEKTKGKKNGTK